VPEFSNSPRRPQRRWNPTSAPLPLSEDQRQTESDVGPALVAVPECASETARPPGAALRNSAANHRRRNLRQATIMPLNLAPFMSEVTDTQWRQISPAPSPHSSASAARRRHPLRFSRPSSETASTFLPPRREFKKREAVCCAPPGGVAAFAGKSAGRGLPWLNQRPLIIGLLKQDSAGRALLSVSDTRQRPAAPRLTRRVRPTYTPYLKSPSLGSWY